jgi:hypothetical protein
MNVLPPVHPNPGIRVGYRSKLERAIDAMNNSISYWLGARFKENPVSSARVRDTLRELGRRWQSNFDELAPDLAREFGHTALNHTTRRIQRMLSDAGWTVEFKPTVPLQNIMRAAVAENVNLITSLPAQHLHSVNGIVFRGVMAGGDLGTMTKQLQQRADTTRERAAFIARDQNSKLTAVITRERQQQAGIQQAIWMHSSAGVHPRREHVLFAAGRWTGSAGKGPLYDPIAGVDFENGEGVVWPGTAINCRCTSRILLPGFETRASMTTPTGLYEKSIERAR